MSTNIVLIGPPGCGKGTQSSLIAQKLKLTRIVAGDIIRDFVKNNKNDEIAIKISETINSGKLISAELVFKMIDDYIKLHPNKFGYVFDGYPRSTEQDKYFKKLIQSNVCFINFIIEEDVLVTRLTKRYQCKDCSSVYNQKLKPTAIEGICDNCGSKEFFYRKDDEIAIIYKRFEEFRAETLPLIKYYKERYKDNFLDIKADQSIETILTNICSFASSICD